MYIRSRLQSNPSSATLPQHLMQPLYQSSPRGKTDEKFLFIAEHDNDDCEVSAVGGDLTLTLQALQKQVVTRFMFMIIMYLTISFMSLVLRATRSLRIILLRFEFQWRLTLSVD